MEPVAIKHEHGATMAKEEEAEMHTHKYHEHIVASTTIDNLLRGGHRQIIGKHIIVVSLLYPLPGDDEVD